MKKSIAFYSMYFLLSFGSAKEMVLHMHQCYRAEFRYDELDRSCVLRMPALTKYFKSDRSQMFRD